MNKPDKKCTLYLEHDDEPPEKDQHLVTQFKNGRLEVWLIYSIRKIKHKTITHEQGYAIEAYDRPDLVEVTVFSDEGVWVRGEPAFGCYRRPWNWKKQEA